MIPTRPKFAGKSGGDGIAPSYCLALERFGRMQVGYVVGAWPKARLGMLIPEATRKAPGMNRGRPYAETADEALMSWSANGDRRAFDEIVARHGTFALRIAARIVPDRLAAEDIVQDAMVRAWSQASRFDPRRAQFRTWLYRIVVNLCIDQRRRVAPTPLSETFDAVDPGAAADEILAVRERDVALAIALRTLPSRQRAAMTLVYDEGMSGAEAARVLGLSAKAVERLLARARTALREYLLAEYEWKDD